MKIKQRTTLKHKISYTVMILSMVFLMSLLLLRSWQNKIKSQRLDQSMSRKVSRENAETPGPKGKKRPKSVPETSGDFFYAVTPSSSTESDFENDSSQNASQVYLARIDGVWLFRNFETGQDRVLTQDEIKKYTADP